MLSRIDGRATLAEIAAMTALGKGLHPVIARLVQLGAVQRIPGLPPPALEASLPPPLTPNVSTPPPPPSRSSGVTPPPRGDRSSPLPPASPTPPPPRVRKRPDVDEALLDEVCDLDRDAKRRVLTLAAELPDLTHYELLDIPESATKKEVKSAYYRLAPNFHPDRFFRKELGSYKGRMESIFARITEAQDVLVSKEGRAEYDHYLATRAVTEEAERSVEGPLPSLFPPPPASMPPAPFTLPSEPPPPLLAPPPPPRERTSEDDQRRREALASRLRGGSMFLDQEAAPASSTGDSRRAAADTLRKRFQSVRDANDKTQVTRFLEVAEQAAARNDPVSAANAYRLAAKMAPEDASLAELVATWSHKALVSMADAYSKQGEYEERAGRHADAAQSYLRATVGMPSSAQIHDRAAAMLLLARGDVRRAVEVARKATELAPNAQAYRLTLAEAYLAARLYVTARSELDRVLASNPTNERAKALLNQIPR